MTKLERGIEDSVRVSDQVDAQIATPLSPILMVEAGHAVARAREAKVSGRLDDETPSALVAILCAHAAVEASVNAEALRLDPGWLQANERESVETKWSWAIERRTGHAPPKDRGPRQQLKRLSSDRNLIAHFKGVPQPRGGLAVMGPPSTRRRGISQVRAYFDADRAEWALTDAMAVIAAVES